jgi:hypothetical protein
MGRLAMPQLLFIFAAVLLVVWIYGRPNGGGFRN